MRRVLVIGSSGAGKSTLAVTLGQRLKLPVIHLDAIFWQAGWKETPRDIWKQRVAELLQRECWVMDGNYGGTLEERVHTADAVILLDFPRILCLYRVARRAIRHRGHTRPDLAPGCLEQLPKWEFLRWIWKFPTAEMPTIQQILRKHHGNKTIIVLRSRSAVRQFLEALPAALHGGHTDRIGLRVSS